MSQILNVFGTVFSNVTGIKATNTTGTTVFYLESGSQGGSGSVTLQSKTVTPTESSQTVSPDNGYDGLSSVTVDAITATYVGSGITQRSSSDLNATDSTVYVPEGYYSTAASYAISAGSATTPNTTIIANPGLIVSESGLITATTYQTQEVTPSVTAGYVDTGTAGTITVTGLKTQQLTTQGTTVIIPSTTAQTAVAAYTYTTGNVTVTAIPSNYIDTTDATASENEIISGYTAYVNTEKLTGTLVIQNFYTGSGSPSSSLGNNNDLYLDLG